jgi:hypothetical protein
MTLPGGKNSRRSVWLGNRFDASPHCADFFDVAQELPRFLCVPTTGWCELNNGRHVFILPHTTKMPANLPDDELAIFQNKNLL